MTRWKDWLDQAVLDLEHARNARSSGAFNWACFAAQQSAEKAVKAVYLARNLEGWGHVVKRLIEELSEEIPEATNLVEHGRRLDQYYIPTRYPNGFDEGKPADFYGDDDAREAIQHAETILQFCQDQAPRS